MLPRGGPTPSGRYGVTRVVPGGCYAAAVAFPADTRAPVADSEQMPGQSAKPVLQTINFTINRGRLFYKHHRRSLFSLQYYSRQQADK